MPSQKLVCLWVALSAVFLVSPSQVRAAEVHVSPRGSDLGDGSAGRPFSTIRRALMEISSESEAVLYLGPGVYSEESGESFPISFKLGQAQRRPSLTIRGPEAGGPEGSAAVIRGKREDVLLEVVLSAGGERSSVRLEGLQVENGLTGIVVLGEERAEFDLWLLGNRFTGQRYQGVEVVVGERGSARAVVRGNQLDGVAAFGIDLVTRTRGQLEVQVEENRIEYKSASSPASGSGPPRFGMAVYLDVASVVKGSIAQNAFINVPVGILIGESEVEGDGGLLDLRISSCLIAGDPSPERNRLRHGFYLALWQHTRSILRILNNTVVNAQGYGIFQDEPASFPEREQNAELMIAGCIFWQNALGEFSAEKPGGVLPLQYREVRGNILPSSGRGATDGNLSMDPRFTAGYELSADSPALDAGTGMADPGADPGMVLDLRGACRVADGDGDGIYRMDLGALEREGPCQREARPFLRGDCSPSQSLELTDAVAVFEYLFLGGRGPSCLDACDANDDREVNITDGIYTLGYLFLGSPAPPAPHPAPGWDPTPDGLGQCR